MLVANLLDRERGEEAARVVEEVGLPGRLAPLLEQAYRVV